MPTAEHILYQVSVSFCSAEFPVCVFSSQFPSSSALILASAAAAPMGVGLTHSLHRQVQVVDREFLEERLQNVYYLNIRCDTNDKYYIFH